MLKPESVSVLGTPIALIDEASFLDITQQWLAQRDALTPGTFICFRDTHGVILAKSDPALQLAHEKSLMNAPDGMPVVWLARRHSGTNVKRVCGPDMLPAVIRVGQAKGWRHVFLGGTPSGLNALVDSLRTRFPNIVVADAISPPFRPLSDAENEQLLDRIRSAKPDLIWVGLGSPKQELWMSQHANSIPGAISMGVGAAFNVHAGNQKRAPAWLRPTGFEWVWRVAKEPKRLGWRYLKIIPRFLTGVVIEEVKFLVRMGRGRSPVDLKKKEKLLGE
jgi:N-acetylglucosaminyldiphosphoundecaprenol N-acetyl-beta-D-mannosaminyltransferase